MNIMLELAASLAILFFLTGAIAIVLTLVGVFDRWRRRRLG